MLTVLGTLTQLQAQQMTDTVVVRTITFDGLSGKGLSADQILKAQLKLQKMEDGSLAAPATPDAGMDITLAQLSDGQDHVLQLSAVQQVVQAVAAEFNRKRLAAVRALLTRSSLNHLLAKDSDGTLTIKVVEGFVGSISAKTPEGEAGDSAVFERVVRQSPVGEGDVISLDAVDRYVAFLNRHPRRQVDAVVAPGPRQGELALDYQVQQDNPLLLYFQASNTGTDSTGDWRERFGLSHFNLTGADDILTIDYITGNFDDVHYVNASYERPLPGLSRVKGRVFGSYSQYTASDVGVFSTNFEGESTTVGAELVWNFFQHRSLFLDLVGGFTYRDDYTKDNTTLVEGDTEFFVLQTGVRLDLQEDYYSVQGSLLVDTNIPGVADTDVTQLAALGRTDGDTNFSILRYNLTKQLYLEPFFKSFKENPAESTLAHEMYFALRGQHVLNDKRVSPSFMHPIGGFYTVRGYPESFIAGDNAVVFTGEYRLHVPHLFAVKPAGEWFGQPFKWAPDRALGRPDWDLLLRAFVDAGRVTQNDIVAGEYEETLVGAGVGIEFSFKRNLIARADWGWALDDAFNGQTTVTSGSSQIHLSLTLLY
jgi:hemolysin activation/secretion protein